MAGKDVAGARTEPPYVVSWNLTQRCNLRCSHCYMSAFAGADASVELSTQECLGVVEQIAGVSPGALLILTGGEPLVRSDVFEIGARAADRGLSPVLGTNGSMLRAPEARRMRASGILGASVSLDSTDPAKHDGFRRLAGSWQGAVAATEALRSEGLDFSLHMSVTDWNLDEIPAMVALARRLGAKVLNFFFLVRTGRGEGLTDIAPSQYGAILKTLARSQGVGNGGGTRDPVPDPFSTPIGSSDGLLIRAKCAPFFRRIVWEMDPASPLLSNYAEGGCPAGKHYCRIMPDGVVTACPYMPVAAGNLRTQSFRAIWESGGVLEDLRTKPKSGRCGACEFSMVCGGCRCRAYATYGDYLAEDPACDYEPGAHGGKLVLLTGEQTYGTASSAELVWTEAAKSRLARLPGFARGMVSRRVEAYAREKGVATITPEVMAQVRERAEERYGRKFSFREFFRPGARPPEA